MQLAFGEGDTVYFQSGTEALPSGRATVVDVLVEGDRAEPDYLIDLGFGPVLAAGSALSRVFTP